MFRFIPAFAGNTLVDYHRNRKRPVHPRVCGEHATSARIWTSLTVHPRVCGEHYTTSRRNVWMTGSSPRLRGTPRSTTAEAAVSRFIPAFAGNTSSPRSTPDAMPVHPRVCGEHASHAGPVGNDFGSSPRLRGTPAVRGGDRSRVRFIPAFAGNTLHRRRGFFPAAVHPRVCGEHSRAATSSARLPGSSPRLRGTPVLSQREERRSRFIPAFAGNTGGDEEE